MTSSATLRDVTVGEGTDYPFMSPPGLPGVRARQSTVPRLSGGISFTGADVGDGGTLPLEVFVDGATSAAVMSLIDEVVAAWSPSDIVEELELVLAGQTRVYRGRPAGAVPDLQWLLEGHLAAVKLDFTVSDYRWYSATPKSVQVTVASMSGGMDTPMVTPMVTTGSGSTGDVPVTNNGTAPAPWTAFLAGPLTTPRLILGGKVLTVGGTIAAGSTAVLDSREGSLLVNGAPQPWVTVDSEWWDIPPGQSTLSFRAAAGTGSVLVSWPDASY